MNLSTDQIQAVGLFSLFLEDKEAFDMFIIGQAGTGKTTLLSEIVQYLIISEVPHVVCAYTHKAKSILQSKLPEKADVRTLHSFLRKRPGINEDARSLKNLQVTSQFGKPQEIKLLIVDEYSMVGESDAMSIGELQDPEYEGLPKMKVLYVGDERQLPPVGQPFTLQARGDYVHKLTEVQRQGAGPLLDTICEVVDMIDKPSTIHKLEPHEDFHRNIDIPEHIRKNKPKDYVVLAYTNKRVEELNEQINNIIGPTWDRWSPSIRAELKYTLDISPDKVEWVQTYSGPLIMGTKYKTLEHLLRISEEYPIKFGIFENMTEGEAHTYAYIFGHYQYKLLNEELAQKATDSNASIDATSPKRYCRENPHCKECRKRAKAWRDYLTFKECVICVDYPYAQTVHKSQGSTFEWVYIDNTDLSQLLVKNRVELYLKLLYVAISRASSKVFMNS